MSEEKKELSIEEMQKIAKDTDKDSEWNTSLDSSWIVLLLMVCFGGWGSRDTTDHELRERVAKLEGQMDMIRG